MKSKIEIAAEADAWIARQDRDTKVAEVLAALSTRELAEVLAKRTDLAKVCVRADGLVDPAIWPLRKTLGPVSCVDGVAIRRDGNTLLGGIIRRGTMQQPGKLALIGGVVALYESIENAMRRHWKTDLGLEIDFPLGWSHPVCMRQYAPQVDGENRHDFCWDAGKHSYASTHMVRVIGNYSKVVFGEKIGGKEAQNFEWYTLENCPRDTDWSYNMRPTFVEVLTLAHILERGGHASF